MNETQLCPNIDECEEGLHDCDHVCIDQIPFEFGQNLTQKYNCECDTGYFTVNEGRTCQKIVVEISSMANISAATLNEFIKTQAEIRAEQMENETKKLKDEANKTVAEMTAEEAAKAASELTDRLTKSLEGLSSMAKDNQDDDKDPMMAKVNFSIYRKNCC